MGAVRAWQSCAVAAFTVVVNSEINGDKSHGDFRGKLHCCGGVFYMSPPFIGDGTLLRAFVSHFLRVLEIRRGRAAGGFCLNFNSMNYSIMTWRTYPSGTNRFHH